MRAIFHCIVDLCDVLNYSIRLKINWKCMKTTSLFVKICFDYLFCYLLNFLWSIARFFSLWFSQNQTKWTRAPFPLICCSLWRSFWIRLKFNEKCSIIVAMFVDICFDYLSCCVIIFSRSFVRLFVLWFSQNCTKWMRAPFHCFVVLCDVLNYSIRLKVNWKCMKTTSKYVKICFDYLFCYLLNFLRLIARFFSIWFSQNLTKWMRTPFPLLCCSLWRSYWIRLKFNEKCSIIVAIFVDICFDYLSCCVKLFTRSFARYFHIRFSQNRTK